MLFPKPNHKRRAPKRGERGKFNKETRDRIIERDGGKCRECGAIGTEIHHVLYKSRGGRGVFTNGLLLCQLCHKRVHANAELSNKWVARFIDEYGDDFYQDKWDKEMEK